MCAYMVCAHPEMVTGEYATEDDEPYEVRELRSASARLVKAIDATIEFSSEQIKNGSKNALMFNELVVQFAQIWDEYVRAFSIWKTNDATALEAELVRIAVAMEASMLRKCGEVSSQANAEEPIDDIRAIREQTCSDRELLRTKVRELSGDVGVLRFDDAIRATRESVRAERLAALDSLEETKNSSLHESEGHASEKKFEERRKQRFQHSQQLLREKEEAKKNLAQGKNERLQRMSIMAELLADITWLPFQLEDTVLDHSAKDTTTTTVSSVAGLEHRVHIHAEKRVLGLDSRNIRFSGARCVQRRQHRVGEHSRVSRSHSLPRAGVLEAQRCDYTTRVRIVERTRAFANNFCAKGYSALEITFKEYSGRFIRVTSRSR